MQHILTVNILMAVAFATSLTTQLGLVDIASTIKTETAQVQGTETQTKEENTEIRRQEIETKRLEAEQKTAAKKAAVTEKLSGKRAEKCEAKQEQINRMLDDRSTAATRHYKTFAAIHERLDAYVNEKELVIEHSSARQLILPEAQDTARVAIEALESATFDCATADATAPGMIVKEQVADAKKALKDYRSAIKDYAEAVKTAATLAESKPAEPVTEEQEATNE